MRLTFAAVCHLFFRESFTDSRVLVTDSERLPRETEREHMQSTDRFRFLHVCTRCRSKIVRLPQGIEYATHFVLEGVGGCYSLGLQSHGYPPGCQTQTGKNSDPDT